METQWQDRLDRLDDRCERLERSNRRLKKYSGLFVSLMLTGAAIGFRGMDKADPLNTTSLTVCNEEGVKLAWIGEDEGAGRIKLFDLKGEEIWTAPMPSKHSKPSEPAPEVMAGLTQEQVEKMNLEESQTALKRVADARRWGDHDAATSKRLKNEFQMLIKRIAFLRGQDREN